MSARGTGTVTPTPYDAALRRSASQGKEKKMSSAIAAIATIAIIVAIAAIAGIAVIAAIAVNAVIASAAKRSRTAAVIASAAKQSRRNCDTGGMATRLLRPLRGLPSGHRCAPRNDGIVAA